ncbi:MAG: histidine phosphatase family protein [Gemmataceae bacterium]
MPTTRVLLLRHAETSDPSVFHGAESDVGLSDRGRLQAERAADALASLAPDSVVSSAMRRAVDTARVIAARCGKELRTEPDLHERRVGTLSGKPRGTPDDPWPETLRRWQAGETDYAHPGAESFDAMHRRLLPVWERLTAEHAGRTLVIVAHGIVCRVLLVSLLEGYGLATWKGLGGILNVGIHELVREGDGPWRAVRLNDLPPGVG